MAQKKGPWSKAESANGIVGRLSARVGCGGNRAVVAAAAGPVLRTSQAEGEEVGMESDTVPTASNGGRGPRGQFGLGNQFAKGNPIARKAQQLRAGLMRAVTAGDLRAVVRKLIDLAKAGDVQAARLVLDRTLGPPVEVDLIERLENLEAAVLGRKE